VNKAAPLKTNDTKNRAVDDRATGCASNVAMDNFDDTATDMNGRGARATRADGSTGAVVDWPDSEVPG
jgi:hypothetical protein